MGGGGGSLLHGFAGELRISMRSEDKNQSHHRERKQFSSCDAFMNHCETVEYPGIVRKTIDVLCE